MLNGIEHENSFITLGPGCIACHFFDTDTLCLQKMGKFISKTNVLKFQITLKSQSCQERSGANGPLAFFF